MTGVTGPTGPSGHGGDGGHSGDGGAAQGTPEERLRALGIAGAPDPPGPTDPTHPADPTVAARVRVELAAAPTPRLPPHVLAAVDRALAGERPTEQGVSRRFARAPGASAPRSSRSLRRPLVLVAAAVLLLAFVGVIALTARPGAPAPRAAPPDATPSGSVDAPGPPRSGGPEVASFGRADLPRALRGGLGAGDFGVLAAPGRLASCLGAHGVPPASGVVGARRVVLDGVPGVLLVLPTGVAARFRLLVVGEDCRAGTPSTLEDTVVGL